LQQSNRKAGVIGTSFLQSLARLTKGSNRVTRAFTEQAIQLTGPIAGPRCINLVSRKFQDDADAACEAQNNDKSPSPIQFCPRVSLLTPSLFCFMGIGYSYKSVTY
jgi:hypothetical protein